LRAILTMSAIFQFAQRRASENYPPKDRLLWQSLFMKGTLAGYSFQASRSLARTHQGTSFNRLTTSKWICNHLWTTRAWQFTFAKEGYKPVSLNYNVTKTHEAAAYLQKITQSSRTGCSDNLCSWREPQWVATTRVQITGTDAAENSFVGITDSNGLRHQRQPGAWQFTILQRGLQTLAWITMLRDSWGGCLSSENSSLGTPLLIFFVLKMYWHITAFTIYRCLWLPCSFCLHRIPLKINLKGFQFSDTSIHYSLISTTQK